METFGPTLHQLTSVLFLERPLAQYCDGELKGEHTDMASSLAAKKVEQKHLKVIIKEPYVRQGLARLKFWSTV